MAKKDLVAYSQSRAMLAIIKASFQAILANPSALVFSIAFPILFVLIFGALAVWIVRRIKKRWARG